MGLFSQAISNSSFLPIRYMNFVTFLKNVLAVRIIQIGKHEGDT